MSEETKAPATARAPTTPTQKLRTALTWVGPYVITALVIAFLLERYSWREIRAEMAKGAVLPLIPIALVAYVVSLVFVALADGVVLRGLLPAPDVPPFFALARGKAASVLLHIVHYSLGQGAYATWLARRSGLRVAKAGGLILYIISGELGSITAYATLVILAAEKDIEYDIVVKAMDALRTKGPRILFPDVQLSPGIVGITTNAP